MLLQWAVSDDGKAFEYEEDKQEERLRKLAREREKNENPEPDSDQKFQDLTNLINGMKYMLQLCTKSFLADAVRCWLCSFFPVFMLIWCAFA